MMEKKVEEFMRNPKKALFTLAWPIVIATIVQTLYNIIDTAYVGRLGSDALAAITFSFPLFFILIAVNSGINAGMSSRISRFLGEKKRKEAENTAIHGLLIAGAVSLIVAITGNLFLSQIFSVFGAKGDVKLLGMSYMSVILYGVIFMFMAYAYNGIFAAQGNTKTPMKIMITSSIINLILDPFFIFEEFNVLGITVSGLGLGIAGAALATVGAFFIGFVIFIIAIRKSSYLHIHMKNFNLSWPILKDIIYVGMPSSLMLLIMSIYVMFLNRVMVYFSTDHVAAFGMATRLESVAMMPIVGFSIGLLTLVGMFYGARRYDLLKEISSFGIKIGIAVTSGLGLLFFMFPNTFLGIFTNDPHLLELGVPYLRLDVFTFPLMAVTMMISRVMQGTGKGFPGLVLNLLRIFIVAIPLAYFFVFYLGLSYIYVAIAMILGGLASSAAGVIWLTIRIRKLENKKK